MYSTVKILYFSYNVYSEICMQILGVKIRIDNPKTSKFLSWLNRSLNSNISVHINF